MPEVKAAISYQDLPEYAVHLAAFHRAFRPELQAAVQSLPLHNVQRVLDVGCGDGFYLGLFGASLQPSAIVTGLDTNPAFLKVAQQNWNAQRSPCQMELVVGSLGKAPLEPGSFDLVWCAQSLFSLPEPVAAVSHMARLAKPGGVVAVLENDTIHQVMLPWPTRLEIVLRSAELAALIEQSDHPAKFYVGRQLPAIFAKAGLSTLRYRTQTMDRAAPLDQDTTTFLEGYLDRLADRVAGRLPEDAQQQFAELIDRRHPQSLLSAPQFTCTCINVLTYGFTKE